MDFIHIKPNVSLIAIFTMKRFNFFVMILLLSSRKGEWKLDYIRVEILCGVSRFEKNTTTLVFRFDK